MSRSKTKVFFFHGLGAHAALEVGAYHALVDSGESFDVLAGMSAGAIQAAALAEGWSPEALAQAWRDEAGPRPGPWQNRFELLSLLGQSQPFRLRRDLSWVLGRGQPFELSPLRRILEGQLKLGPLPPGAPKLWILAYDEGLRRVRALQPEFLLPEHLLASCSLPWLFPSVPLEGSRFSDPSFRSGPLSTLVSALPKGSEITLILPRPLPEPRVHGLLRRMFRSLPVLRLTSEAWALQEALGRARFRTLSPEVQLGPNSWFDYRKGWIHRLLDEGYHGVRSQLGTPKSEAKRARSFEASPGKAKPPAKPKAQSKPNPKQALEGDLKVRRKRSNRGRGKKKEPSLGF